MKKFKKLFTVLLMATVIFSANIVLPTILNGQKLEVHATDPYAFPGYNMSYNPTYYDVNVAKFQNELNYQGYYCGPADGFFGSNTLTAVRNWQYDHGLTVDGVVGRVTWNSIFGL